MKNPTLLRCFHWYYPAGGELQREVEALAPSLSEIGISVVWLPPAYRGISGGYSVGYDTYNLFDLGEFDQKDSVATRYDDKAQLLAAVKALKEHDVAVLPDTVVNHGMGADGRETLQVQRADEHDCTQITKEIIECEVWTCYTFPVRAGQYSQFVWDYKCFSGTDHIKSLMEDDVFKIVNGYTGEDWNEQVDDKPGSSDYLMDANIDLCNHAVTEEIRYQVRWVVKQTGCNGFRLDAVKHISAWFYKAQIEHVQEVAPQLSFVIAKYWSHGVEEFRQYTNLVEGKTMLFDAPLQIRFHRASRQGRDYDMSQIFNDTLVEADPFHIVTPMVNHDM